MVETDFDLSRYCDVPHRGGEARDTGVLFDWLYDEEDDGYEQASLLTLPGVSGADMIRRERDRQGLSQRDLADHLGASRNTVANWEQGRSEPVEYAEAAAEFAGIDPRVFEDPVENDLENGLTDRAVRIIEGSLLGDASIKADGPGNPLFSQSSASRGFLEYLASDLEDEGIETLEIRERSRGGDREGWSEYTSYSFRTEPYSELSGIEDSWYVGAEVLRESYSGADRQKVEERIDAGINRFKRVPDDFELSPTSLLYWHLGDGCLESREQASPNLMLMTDGFLEEDIRYLVGELESNGISAEMVDKGRIRIPTDSLTDYFGFLPELPDELDGTYSGNSNSFDEKWPNEQDRINLAAKTDLATTRIRNRVKVSDLSVRELAKSAGYSQVVMHDVIDGVQQPSYDRFPIIAEELGIDPEMIWEQSIQETRQSRFVLKDENPFIQGARVYWEGERLNSEEKDFEMLEEERAKAGLSQRDVHSRGPISRSTLRGWENGEQVPEEENLRAYYSFLKNEE